MFDEPRIDELVSLPSLRCLPDSSSESSDIKCFCKGLFKEGGLVMIMTRAGLRLFLEENRSY